MKALTDAQERQKERGQEAKQRVTKLRGDESDEGDEDGEVDEDGEEQSADGQAPAEPAKAGGSGAKARRVPRAKAVAQWRRPGPA